MFWVVDNRVTLSLSFTLCVLSNLQVKDIGLLFTLSPFLFLLLCFESSASEKLSVFYVLSIGFLSIYISVFEPFTSEPVSGSFFVSVNLSLCLSFYILRLLHQIWNLTSFTLCLFLSFFLNHRQVLSTGFVSIYISVFEYYQTLSLYPIISLFVYLLYLRLLHQIQMSNKFYFMSWSWILDNLEKTQ